MIRNRNKAFRNTVLAVSVCSLFAFTGCDFLQGTLSSELNSELTEATGSGSIANKVWYYNGTASTDMSVYSKKSSNQYCAQSLAISFGKKVAINSLSGKTEFTYTDKNGETVTKTSESVSGFLSGDSTVFYLDLGDVVKNITPSENEDGTGLLTVKLGGFVCAEGAQKGRSIAAFEAKNIQIKPLFKNINISYSTVGYSTSRSIKIPTNGAVTFKKYDITAKDSASKEYTFTVSGSDSGVLLTPKSAEAPADQETLTFNLSDISFSGAGDAYSNTFKVTFLKHVIVMDGYEDDNYSAAAAASVTDETGDASAFGYTSDLSDFTKLSVANDDDYLYVGISGYLDCTWGNSIGIMISKDHSMDVSSGNYEFIKTVNYDRDTLKRGKPDFFMYHQPQKPNLGAWVENTAANEADEVSASIIAAPSTSWSSATFTEYAIPLSVLAEAGITKGDTVHVIAIYTADWDDGKAIADAIPDAAVTLNADHDSAKINFQNALAYEVK